MVLMIWILVGYIQAWHSHAMLQGKQDLYTGIVCQDRLGGSLHAACQYSCLCHRLWFHCILVSLLNVMIIGHHLYCAELMKFCCLGISCATCWLLFLLCFTTTALKGTVIPLTRKAQQDSLASSMTPQATFAQEDKEAILYSRLMLLLPCTKLFLIPSV